MSVGSLDPNDQPGDSDQTFTCLGGRVAIAGSGWIGLESGVKQAPILVQIADSNRFSSSFRLDWSLYLDRLTADSRVSWNVTCANVSP